MLRYHRSTLLPAISSNKIHLIRSVLATKRCKWTIDGTDFHMLRKSIECNRKEITELLLDHGCRVNLPSFNRDSPLFLAVANPDCYPLVKRLLQLGADVNFRNFLAMTPIHVAFAEGAESRVMNLLFETYLKQNTLNQSNDDGLSYFHIACSTANLDLVRKFVEEGGVSINLRVKQGCNKYAGRTPLHMAVAFAKMDVIEYLLKKGANVYMKDAHESTPIHLALELGETDIIGLLFEYDDKRRNVRDRHGLSHFMAACACSSPEIAMNFLANRFNDGQLLTRERVDSLYDHDYWLKGFTPLHFAAFFGNREMAQCLLDAGANCRAVTYRDVTPTQLALNHDHQHVADIIKAHCGG